MNGCRKLDRRGLSHAARRWQYFSSPPSRSLASIAPRHGFLDDTYWNCETPRREFFGRITEKDLVRKRLPLLNGRLQLVRVEVLDSRPPTHL